MITETLHHALVGDSFYEQDALHGYPQKDGLSYFYVLIGGSIKLILRICDCSNCVVASFDASQSALNIHTIDGGTREPSHAVPTVRRCENLYVVPMGCSQYHFPIVALDRVVDTILGFIDDEEAVSTIREGQGNAEDAHSTITEALQGDRSRLAGMLYEHSLTSAHAIARPVITHNSDTINGVATDQSQGFNSAIFVFG